MKNDQDISHQSISKIVALSSIAYIKHIMHCPLCTHFDDCQEAQRLIEVKRKWEGKAGWRRAGEC